MSIKLHRDAFFIAITRSRLHLGQRQGGLTCPART